MFSLDKESRDPWFNIALEEHLLRHAEVDIFMLWENSPSLIVGKHQNPFLEIKPEYLLTDTIPVIRRISGGGTVFHGSGNLNFTFITNSKTDEDKINFKKFTQPILDLLNKMGVAAEMTGKSNLTVDGLKFSGNAAHVFKNRSIHHGTLLFDADLALIKHYLRPTTEHINSRAVASIRAQVTNLKPLLPENMALNTFQKKLKQTVLAFFGNEGTYQLTDIEINKIKDLSNSKYKTNTWNFGYSPDYSLSRSIETAAFDADLKLQVNKGVISSVKLSGLKQKKLAWEIERILAGKFHHPKDLQQALEPLLSAKNISKTEQQKLIIQLF
ncbi:MAG: lipoate--protein ligase [Bacteroidetes bacterium]|jgi:lipoate-protein ligase A|nr:lipoate--protein ligase [Bacteroidota bacterium]